ncbi:aspartyl/glutamyl-tRNA amidotransferase subunit A [Microgenomates group bacterium RBG_19FT_COMBO_39_10]|nr:MAG: aspartyl/glutamyl-tRNA amidotransferase subunit A [Microgenomates group bacterium RBG_19FT_COMBO_39_10]
MELNQLTIQEAREGLKKEKFSSEELTKACLRQVKKLDKKINAFITVCEKEALEQAREADKIKSDKPLWGIPIGIKDIYSTRGIKTTAGARVLDDYIPVYDATAVKRLKEAGAIVLGKTNMDAWAHGASGENSDYGPTKNPWNLEYVPGGSSSGSGAALASAMCLAATGTDTGGSIRQPASFCNLVGLKPTYGRVSRYGIIAMASSLDSIGHFTRSVTDSALILGVTAGQDSFDATTPDIPVSDYLKNIKKGVKGLKIGIPKEYFLSSLDKDVKKTIEKVLEKFESLGAKLISVSLPHTSDALAVYYIIQPAEVSSNLARYDGIRYGFPRDRFSDEAKRRIMLGTFTLSTGYYEAYYLKAMRVRTLIKEDFNQAFNQVDVLITPVSPTPAFKLGEKIDDPLKMYLSDVLTVTANLAGLPGLAIPAGFVKGLPVGIQILGPQFSEELLFRTGYAYEQATKWYQRRPKIE